MPTSRHLLRALLGLVLAAAGVLALVAPAAAHTDLASSVPADGATVEGPLSEVVLAFTQPVVPVDGAIVVLDGDGTERVPEVVASSDGASVTLRLDPPAAPGQVAVRWAVRAGDGHVVDGGLVVQVRSGPDAPAPPSSAPSPATTVEGGAGEAAPSTSAAGPEPTIGSGPAEGAAVARSAEVASFLDEVGSADGRERVGAAGRSLALAGGLVAVGALVVGVTVVRGGRRDVQVVVLVVRWAAAVAVVGAGVELVALGSVAGGVTDGPLLRLAGAVGLLVGVRARVAATGAAVAGAAGAGAGPGAAGVAGGGTAVVERSEPDLRLAWGGSPLAGLGAALLLVSLAIGGHTATEGPRLVAAAIDLVHAAAGATWAGGVVVLAVVLRDRARRGRPTGAAELGARFSAVATGAIVAVALAGVALTAIVLEGPGDLVGTAWGRLLAVKVGLVAVAAALGAHNHRVLVPALAADEPGAGTRFARVLSIEAVVLVAVLATTAWLVAADPSG